MTKKIKMREAISKPGKLAALLLSLTFLISGCATTSGNPRDPHESFNRAMFDIHEGIDTVIAKPLAKGYDSVAPLPVKASVGNFFGNAGDLLNGVNNTLQGKGSEGASDFARLLINSTIGILGLFDVASEMGLDKHNEDFGQTFARWGMGDGGYLFLPILGPRTVRDTVGLVLDSYVDPITYIQRIPARNGAMALRAIDLRASLLPSDKVVEEAALDKYAYTRDAYLQRRRNLIFDGNPPKTNDEY